MKNRKLMSLMAAVVLLVLTLCACGAQEEADGALTAIKDDNGNITGYERRYHNADGYLSRWDVYDAQEVYDHFVLYDYDDNGRLIQETTYQANGIGEYYYTYAYDDDGNLTEKGYYTAYDGAEIILYDADGAEAERYIYSSNDELTAHEVFVDGAWVTATEDSAESTDTTPTDITE